MAAVIMAPLGLFISAAARGLPEERLLASLWSGVRSWLSEGARETGVEVAIVEGACEGVLVGGGREEIGAEGAAVCRAAT